ncbi:MAG TPA: PP2C family protein-serine/threonine phosphatase [bacterium]|nr:PP2C family protein-serine/threonine phosphatase [bacterium]
MTTIRETTNIGETPEEGRAGFAVLCDAQTIIRHVLCDDLGLYARIELRPSFVALIDGESTDKARRFLGAISTHGVAFDWWMNVMGPERVMRMHFAGTTTSSGILIVGAPSGPALGLLCEELLDSGDDAIRGIRSDVRALVLQAKSAPTVDPDLDTEVRRLREELAEVRHELVRRDADLTPDPDFEQRAAEAFALALLPRDLPQHERVVLSAVHLHGSGERREGRTWYDAFRLPEGRVALAVGAVPGRGWRAAVMMSQVRAAIRTLVFEGHSPFSVLTRTSRVVQLSSETAGTATVVFGLLDPSTLTFAYSIAGHPPPMLGTPGGRVEVLSGGGWPLGVRSSDLRPARVASLPNPSLLVLYTAGLVACDEGRREGSVDLRAAIETELRQRSSNPAEAICRRVLGGVPPRVDASMLAVSIGPGHRVEAVAG